MAASNWAATAPGIASGLPGLTAAQIAAAYGTGTGSGLYGLTTLGNALTNPLVKQAVTSSLGKAVTSSLGKVLGVGGANTSTANGMAANGMAANGMAANGMAANGTAASGMANSGPTSSLYRIGDTKYSPYSQNLEQLNLAPDEFIKQSDIGNIPVYSTDVVKMANAPFASPFDPFTQYAAEGGSIHHFDRGGPVYEDDPASTPKDAPQRTPEQQAAYEAMQQNLQYYKDLGEQKQNDKMMSGLKALAGVGAAEATPPSNPMIRLGQTGVHTPPKVLPQLAALLQARGMRLAEGGQPDDHSHPNYDGTPVFRTGGLSGLGGKYVEGKGDGTSDDITAMLADGEYVFSADVVSALGNGSNKAGAQVLDKTVQAIRSRARSTAPDKLPPDAKSPLEYMQAVKGKKYG